MNSRKDFSKLSTLGGSETCPSELSAEYMEAYERGETMTEFLCRFAFKSKDAIRVAVMVLARCIVNDPYFCPENRKKSGDVRCIFTRFDNVLKFIDKSDKYARSISEEVWNGYFVRELLAERTAAAFAAKPDPMIYEQVAKRIADTYNLTLNDLEKLRFFICQVKAGRNFPKSLRRMLYVWGREKKTGKTTCAEALTCALNGESSTENVLKYKTTLSNEMQIKSFAVPRIAEANVCTMDECFYADMGKTYADFKRFITSVDGVARLPYGQPFNWFGMPNYIATSNEPLQRFIKDWNDRRYLSVEFKAKPSVSMTFGEIFELWRLFAVHAEPLMSDWAAWAERIAAMSDESGEMTIVSGEFEAELRQADFLQHLVNEHEEGAKTSNLNRRTLKYFVDWFARYDVTARKARAEIEAAVVKVFGARNEGRNYWILSDLKQRAYELLSDGRDLSQIESADPFSDDDLFG